MTRFFALAFWLLLPLTLQAQTTEWAQRVQYDMDIRMLAEQNQMEGTQHVVYTNNSPDTLKQIFYHLYFNAFHPQSMMAERNRHLPDPDSRVVPRIFNLGPDEIGYHRVETLQQDGTPLAFEITDTVLRAELARPIPPGGSATFTMEFNSQVPLQTRRSGRDSNEGIRFSMSQWYPKIAAYDQRGWHPDPYVGREFYAPFGTFDVRITLPAEYVVGATGVLQNPQDVGHGYAPGNGQPQNGMLTWHFRADNVHDFAWAADPDYVHDVIPGPGGTTFHLLYQPDVADRWEPMKQWVPAIFAYFNEHYGPYAYEQFTVAQAGDGGMEYPQIIFITGRRSPASLFGVTAHEIAHEWYYGMIGSNEAAYAWIDEGFTEYITEEVTAALFGEETLHHPAYLSYLNVQEQGLLERPNTPSDWFATNRAYTTASYTLGEMLLAMLGYIIGDAQRDAFLQRLYQEYRYRHVDPYDLELLAEKVSGLQLDWYFEQFTNTTRRLDYAIEDLEVNPILHGSRAKVTIKRLGEMVMPQDVRLTMDDGSVQWVTIPLGMMHGHKPVPEGWIVAAPWPWTFPEYTLTVDTRRRVVKAELDPLGRTPDRNRLNNTSSFPLDVTFLQPPRPDWFTYSVGFAPVASYSHEYRLGVGVQARGNDLFGRNPFVAELKLQFPEHDATPWHDFLDYEFRYRNALERFGPTVAFTLDLRKRLGIMENRLRFERELGSLPALQAEQKLFYVELGHQTRLSERAYSGFVGFKPSPWSKGQLLTARLGLDVQDGDDHLGFFVQAGALINANLESFYNSNYNDVAADRANLLGLDAVKTWDIGPLVGRAAFATRIGHERLVGQQAFALGAAPLVTQWRNDAYRISSAPFEQPLDDQHMIAFAGVGPVAQLAEGRFRYWSNIVAGSLSLGTGPLAPNGPLSALSFDVFSGAGFGWDPRRDVDGDELKADAGLGATLDVGCLVPARWRGLYDSLGGLVIEARFPLWVSDPERIGPEENALDFRWLIGIRTGL